MISILQQAYLNIVRSLQILSDEIMSISDIAWHIIGILALLGFAGGLVALSFFVTVTVISLVAVLVCGGISLVYVTH